MAEMNLSDHGIVDTTSLKDDLSIYLSEINNITILNNLDYSIQGNLFYKLSENGSVIYIDHKTGNIADDFLIEQSFRDEIKHIVNLNKGDIKNVLYEKSFNKFDYSEEILYITILIGKFIKRIYLDSETGVEISYKDLTNYCLNNNWIFNKDLNLWYKWDYYKMKRKVMDIYMNPIIELSHSMIYDINECIHLPINLRPPKLIRSINYIPKPKLMYEINFEDKDGYPIIMK